MIAVTLNGHTYSDDSNPATGLGNGGHRTRFIPALSDALVELGVKQSAAALSAAAAAASATASAAASGAVLWVSGTNYGAGIGVWSPLDWQTYRRKTAGAGATDPSLDPVNWEKISFGGDAINTIGTPGAQGFGVGICPGPLPAGMSEMFGCRSKNSDNYGNYQYSDGSAMVWIPAFYYKWGTGANGLAVNEVSVHPVSYYADVAAANADGHALHRAFYDGGAVQAGVFVDKYLASNNAGTASSIKNGNPLSSHVNHNPFSGLTGAPTDAIHGAIVAAKTRGADFFCSSRFIFAALALLSYAHAQASSSTTYCAWYHATNNFPKGCNNNALGDAQDADILYVWDGYAANNSAKTGSANLFSRTTHNGQNCGVADLNGGMNEITPGLTAFDGSFYILKTAARMADATGGNTFATDLFGELGTAALYDALGYEYEALSASATTKYYGAAVQVFSEATSGLAWNFAGLGGPLAGGVGGTNAFGNDKQTSAAIEYSAPVSGGWWGIASHAGVWALNISYTNATASANLGFRAALYL